MASNPLLSVTHMRHGIHWFWGNPLFPSSLVATPKRARIQPEGNSENQSTEELRSSWQQLAFRERYYKYPCLPNPWIQKSTFYADSIQEHIRSCAGPHLEWCMHPVLSPSSHFLLIIPHTINLRSASSLFTPSTVVATTVLLCYTTCYICVADSYTQLVYSLKGF